MIIAIEYCSLTKNTKLNFKSNTLTISAVLANFRHSLTEYFMSDLAEFMQCAITAHSEQLIHELRCIERSREYPIWFIGQVQLYIYLSGVHYLV